MYWKTLSKGIGAILAALALFAVVRAQSGRMSYEAMEGKPLRLSQASFYYHELPISRTISKYDIITVIVNIRTQVLSEGEVNRRKRASFDFTLSDWFRLAGLNLKPAPQLDGDPKAKGSLNEQYRVQGELETRDRMQFTIAATVVDVRPNGNLVIEARQTVTNNSEVWKQSLRGIVRPEDILPNNRVLSENIADLKILKEEKGLVPSTYQRGWLMRMYDHVKPF